MSNARPDLVVGSPEALAGIFAERCQSRAGAAIGMKGVFAIMIPGGSALQAFLPALAGVPLDWKRTHFFWGDERAVPQTSSQSNFGTAWRVLKGLPAGALAPLHPMPADTDDLDGGAAAYSEELASLLGRPPAVDVALIGVGEDGHVCSLFPGHSSLSERSQWVVPVRDAPVPPTRRLTVTMPVLEAARVVCVAAFGLTKADVVRRAVEGADADLPLAAVLRRERETWLFLDRDAASGLSSA